MAAHLGLPVYMRIGASSEVQIGTVTFDPDEVLSGAAATLVNSSIADLLRAAADEFDKLGDTRHGEG